MDGEGSLKAKFEAAKANRDLLDNCPRHSFDAIPISQIAFGGRATCKRCNGEMDLVALNYYVRGYEAAGKSGNDILPGWKEEQPGNVTTRRFFKAPE